jgi:N4-gp56 family major capsid protein
MAQTEFGVNHPLAVKVWSKNLANEAYRKTFIGKFIGEGEDSLIQEKVDLKKSAGDQITCGLNVQLQGDGVQGDATLEGSEEALQFYDDALRIDQLRHATRTKGRMTEQRVPYDLRRVSRDRLADWWAQRMDQLVPLAA